MTKKKKPEYNNMRAVGLTEMHVWMLKNKHLTSWLGKGGGFSEDGKAAVRYLEFVFDTRTMEIHCIKGRLGWKTSKDVILSCVNQPMNSIVQEHKFETILDYLDFEIKGVL